MFTSFQKHLTNFLRDEDGPTSVEYAIVITLTILICMPAIAALGTRASQTFTSVSRSIGGSGS